MPTCSLPTRPAGKRGVQEHTEQQEHCPSLTPACPYPGTGGAELPRAGHKSPAVTLAAAKCPRLQQAWSMECKGWVESISGRGVLHHQAPHFLPAQLPARPRTCHPQLAQHVARALEVRHRNDSQAWGSQQHIARGAACGPDQGRQRLQLVIHARAAKAASRREQVMSSGAEQGQVQLSRGGSWPGQWGSEQAWHTSRRACSGSVLPQHCRGVPHKLHQLLTADAHAPAL